MNASAVVALVPCESYDEKEVNRAISLAVDLLGGWSSLVQAEEKILLKPNLLRKAAPAEAVTTHPAIVKAVGLSLREAGCTHLSYGDSPGSHSMESVAKASGIAAAASEVGLSPADFQHSETQEHEGILFALCKGALEADAIISLSKMKTHALQKITGAVKNLYGCVYGVQKAAGHTQFPDAKSFADMLMKLERALKPRLHIMDGIMAMEGNGPAAGDPVRMNVILASANPYALDQVYCRLIALNPALVPTNAFDPAQTVIIRTPGGDISWQEALSLYGNKDFAVDRSGSAPASAHLQYRVVRALGKRPVIQKELCQKCMVCVENCPLSGKAIRADGEYPVYDYKECIRCYCCQEMCPHNAIVPKQPIFGKLLAGQWQRRTR